MPLVSFYTYRKDQKKKAIDIELVKMVNFKLSSQWFKKYAMKMEQGIL